MIERKNKKEIRKAVCLRISKKLYTELNRELVNKFGNVHGHIGEAINEGIKLWLEKQGINIDLILSEVIDSG